MGNRYRRRPARFREFRKAIQALHRHGYDPRQFRIEVLEPNPLIEQWDAWSLGGLLEISILHPCHHTEFYALMNAHWLGDFERDLAAGAFRVVA